MEAAIPILKKLGVGCAIIPFIPFNIGTSFEEGLQACRSSEALLRENGMILGYHNMRTSLTADGYFKTSGGKYPRLETGTGRVLAGRSRAFARPII